MFGIRREQRINGKKFWAYAGNTVKLEEPSDIKLYLEFISGLHGILPEKIIIVPSTKNIGTYAVFLDNDVDVRAAVDIAIKNLQDKSITEKYGKFLK